MKTQKLSFIHFISFLAQNPNFNPNPNSNPNPNPNPNPNLNPKFSLPCYLPAIEVWICAALIWL